MKKLLFLICFSLISILVSAQWTWQNPLPQGNCITSIYFTNIDTGYAVGVGGTILKTVNGGITWTTIPVSTAVTLQAVLFTDILTSA